MSSNENPQADENPTEVPVESNWAKAAKPGVRWIVYWSKSDVASVSMFNTMGSGEGKRNEVEFRNIALLTQDKRSPWMETNKPPFVVSVERQSRLLVDPDTLFGKERAAFLSKAMGMTSEVSIAPVGVAINQTLLPPAPRPVSTTSVHPRVATSRKAPPSTTVSNQASREALLDAVECSLNALSISAALLCESVSISC